MLQLCVIFIFGLLVPVGTALGHDESLHHRVETINKFLAAGGDRLCDIPRLDGHGLSWTTFSSQYRGRTVVIENLSHERQLANWTRDQFLRTYSDHLVKTNNGHFDHLRSKAVITVGHYLSRNMSEFNLFSCGQSLRGAESNSRSDLQLCHSSLAT